MGLLEKKQQLSGNQPKKIPKPIPPSSKGPYERRGGIPREKFPEFLKKGPYSIFGSRKIMPEQRKKIGEKLLKERFPRGIYGTDISGREIDREIRKLKESRLKAKTKAEQDLFTQNIVRLEETKKRAGL